MQNLAQGFHAVDNLLPMPFGHSVLNKKLHWNLVIHCPEFGIPELFLGHNSWGYSQSCFNPKSWCLPLVGPGDFFLWHFHFYWQRVVRIPRPGDVIFSQYYHYFCNFCFGREKLLVQNSLWLQSPAIFQIPGNHDPLCPEVNSGFQLAILNWHF